MCVLNAFIQQFNSSVVAFLANFNDTWRTGLKLRYTDAKFNQELNLEQMEHINTLQTKILKKVLTRGPLVICLFPHIHSLLTGCILLKMRKLI